MKFNEEHKFNVKYNTFLELINDALDKIITEKESPEKSIYQATRYSLMVGGKRLRPVLSLAVCEMFAGDIKEIIPYACAIEIIHTYSLIHDDLPAMDNDDYRRGKPTNHKVYGEARAILAGDALLTYAFEIMTDSILNDVGRIYNEVYDKVYNRLNDEVDDKISSFKAKVKAINYIAKAAGASGMIGGQIVDLESEDRLINGELLKYMHKCKTGAIIKASVLVPAILMELDKKDMACLEIYSQKSDWHFK